MSQSQCRSLEDAIEDRDKEVDQLKRKLELLLRKAGGLDQSSEQTENSKQVEDSLLIKETTQPTFSDNGSGDTDPKRPSLGRLFRRK
jgi:predicted RNase H-like nuclease (RuvC/YqgF family)